jgi:hypothetical protein
LGLGDLAMKGILIIIAVILFCVYCTGAALLLAGLMIGLIAKLLIFMIHHWMISLIVIVMVGFIVD